MSHHPRVNREHQFYDLNLLVAILRTYDHIPPNLIEWMVKQYLFFVATSALPSASSALSRNTTSTDGKEDGWKKNEEWGYANVSPKDMQGFEVVNDRCVRCESRHLITIWKRHRR